jgi:hypothetical protein
MKRLVMWSRRSSASLLLSSGLRCYPHQENAVRMKRVPSRYLPRFAIAIIALLICLYCPTVTLKCVMSNHFAIDTLVSSPSTSAKCGDGPFFEDTSKACVTML